MPFKYYSVRKTMPHVAAKGQVTSPKEICDVLGIESDEIAFEKTEFSSRVRREATTTKDENDPFEKYRVSADRNEPMPDRMRRLRGEYPCDVGDDEQKQEKSRSRAVDTNALLALLYEDELTDRSEAKLRRAYRGLGRYHTYRVCRTRWRRLHRNRGSTRSVS